MRLFSINVKQLKFNQLCITFVKYCQNVMLNLNHVVIMEPIIFNYRSRFHDKIQYVCVPQSISGCVDKVYDYTVYVYVNDVYKRSYQRVLATSYTHLNKQLNVLFENF